ncbi:MAG: MFS transporter, partial [Tepidiformaceae bacterium]
MTSPEISAALLKQRPFRMLSLTRFESRVAQNALNFGLVLLIVDETGKAFLSSLLVLALVIPSTVAGIVAGTAADVLPKRLLIVLGDLGRAAVCILFIRGSGNLATYYVAAVALSTFGQFATSAEGATLPAIVYRSELTRANAVGHAVGGIAQLVGLAILTPVILRVFNSPNLLFGICAGLFIIASFHALLIGSTRSRTRREIGGELSGRWWLAGWRQMRSDPLVMHAAVELTLIAMALVILGGLIPKYIEDTLGLPVDIGAVILTPAAIGVALGLQIANFLAHRLPHTILSTFGFAGFVICLGLVTFVNQESSFLAGYGMFSWLGSINIGNFDGGGVLAMGLMLPLGFAYALVSVSAQTIIN